MKVKLGTIIDSISALNVLGSLEKQVKMKLAYHAGKQLAKINKELKYFSEKNNVLVGKYKTSDTKDGPKVDPNTPEYVEFMREKNELLATEVELNIQKINLSEFADKDGNSLLPISAISILEWLDAGAEPKDIISDQKGEG